MNLMVYAAGGNCFLAVSVAPRAGQLAAICFLLAGLIAGLASFCGAFSTTVPRTQAGKHLTDRLPLWPVSMKGYGAASSTARDLQAPRTRSAAATQAVNAVLGLICPLWVAGGVLGGECHHAEFPSASVVCGPDDEDTVEIADALARIRLTVDGAHRETPET
ncbi:hypothetical protein [Streptomyces sp. NPDC056188]|uniref:hypothetical protein n=1 Tax=Streptomyces sp. NPDC056188 TaxID=3345740 RepID=UPI0035DD592D